MKTPRSQLDLKNTSLDSLVRVNEDACLRIANFLSTQEVPLDQEESSLPGFARGFTGNFFLALVAICHQTTPRGQPPLEGRVAGVLRRGWDYLLARLESAARRDLSLLTPQRWSCISTDEVRQLFRDRDLGDRLTSPGHRAELLRDLGQTMMAEDWPFADTLYDRCGGWIARGDPNLLQLLSRFRAYDDPVRKKSYLFLALMRNSGIWHYADDESLGPPVDYHEVRGHLRLGTVYIHDPVVLEKVRSNHKVTCAEDVVIRQAVHDAIMLISEHSGIRNPSQMHYLFWNLFRSICTREEPQCFALRPGSRVPHRYSHLLARDGVNLCPFATLCQSAGSPDPICEHVFETDYY